MSAVVFRWRGFLFLPLVVVFLVWGRPSVRSFVIGFIVALFGEALRIWGVGYAGGTTRSSEVCAPYLVTAGPYGYVENPLYLGNFIMGFGFFLMSCGVVSLWTRLLFLVLLLFFYSLIYGAIIPLEESYLLTQFGDGYHRYAQAVHRLLPRKTPYHPALGTFSWAVIGRSEVHTLIYFALMTIIMYAKIIL
ncbi:MAG: isoprenylcysteine carboxylmethyltransferase family protein [Armatimonadetes bacterium]|nr:isoprenylcysteine carboxylmethyltransferase family protein [Armatimonadota bacterium]